MPLEVTAGGCGKSLHTHWGPPFLQPFLHHSLRVRPHSQGLEIYHFVRNRSGDRADACGNVRSLTSRIMWVRVARQWPRAASPDESLNCDGLDPAASQDVFSDEVGELLVPGRGSRPLRQRQLELAGPGGLVQKPAPGAASWPGFRTERGGGPSGAD